MAILPVKSNQSNLSMKYFIIAWLIVFWVMAVVLAGNYLQKDKNSERAKTQKYFMQEDRVMTDKNGKTWKVRYNTSRYGSQFIVEEVADPDKPNN